MPDSAPLGHHGRHRSRHFQRPAGLDDMLVNTTAFASTALPRSRQGFTMPWRWPAGFATPAETRAQVRRADTRLLGADGLRRFPVPFHLFACTPPLRLLR